MASRQFEKIWANNQRRLNAAKKCGTVVNSTHDKFINSLKKQDVYREEKIKLTGEAINIIKMFKKIKSLNVKIKLNGFL